MQVLSLPSERCGDAANADELAALLDKAIGLEYRVFRFVDRVLGHSRSCRILFCEEVFGFTTTAELPSAMGTIEMAEEFFRQDFMPVVRYNPPEPPTVKHQKGWEVFSAKALGNKPIVILWASWVTRP